MSQAADGDAAFDWSIAFTLPSSDFALRLSGNEPDATALQRQIAAHLTDHDVHCRVLSGPAAGAFRIVLTGDGGARQFKQVLHTDLQQHIHITGGAAHLSVRGVFDQGQTLELVLESNPSTGSLWEVDDASLPLFSSIEDVSYRPVEAHVGAPAKQIVRLTAARPGEATFGLDYRRPWEESQPVLWIAIHAQELPEILDLSSPLPPLSAASLVDTWEQHTASIGFAADRLADTNDAGWAAASLALPPSFDWRTLGRVTPVRDQGNCGSCWAFAVVGVMESAMLVYGEPARDLSEQYLVSCNVDGYNCSGGNMNAHSYHVYEEGQLGNPPGAVLESDFPYIAADGSCGQVYAHPYRLDQWGYTPSDGLSAVEQIKQYIYGAGPIGAHVCVGPNFQRYQGGIFQTDESSSCPEWYPVNHAVVLVGWNDAEQTWILRNSWGPGWGEGGYMRIRWGTSNVGYEANYVEYSPVNPLPIAATLSPTLAYVGDPSFYLNVYGSKFTYESVVRWNGADLLSPYCAPVQCMAKVRPSDMAQTGTVTITVFTPAPGGGLSNGLTLTVYPNPVPAITSLDPPAVLSTTSSLMLRVYGDGFVSGSKVWWGGSQLDTVYRSRTYLQGLVLSPALATPGTISVTVSSPTPGGGTSNTMLFRIIDPATLTNKVYLPLVLRQSAAAGLIPGP